MKIFWLVLICLVASCASVPSSTNEFTLRKVIVPAVQKAYDNMQADEYEAVLPILDALIAGDPVELTPYEMATVLELRANAKVNLEDYDGAKADLEAAYVLDAFPPDRQAQLKRYIDLGFERFQERNLVPLSRIPPRTPQECIDAAAAMGRAEDWVEMEFDIATDGSTENIMVTNSSNECLNEAAIESVSKWKYAPQIKKGVAIRVENQKTAIGFVF